MPASRKLLLLLEPLARLHRWLGIAVGFMVVLWFISGTVLSFQPFPSLSAAAQRDAAAPIDFTRVLLAPAQALQRAPAGSVQRLRLKSVDGHPRYLLSLSGQSSLAVDAASGEVLAPTDAAQARRIAEAFSRARAREVEGPVEVDRWTVHDRYVSLRPFWRVSLDDAEGTELYVSRRSGEVVQRTRRSERAWNTVGALLHWLNIGTLRRSFDLWHATIFSVASLALLLVALGALLGVARWRAARTLRQPRHSPFRGLLRWHHLAGLCGVFIIGNWLVSGWLSLDQGLFFVSDQPSPAQLAALRGASFEAALRDVPLAAVVAAGEVGGAGTQSRDVREIEWRVLGARAVMSVQGPPSPVASLQPAVLPDELLLTSVAAAWPGVQTLLMGRIAENDDYALRGNPYAPSVRRIELGDAARTWVHIDAATGEIVSVMDASRRRYRWWVDGLHHLDYPALNAHGEAWHVLLVLGTFAGMMFSASGVWLALRRLRRN